MIKIIIISLLGLANLNSSENQIKPSKELIKSAWELSSRISPNPVKFKYVFDRSLIKRIGEEKLVKIFKDLYSKTGSVLKVSTVSFTTENYGDFFFHTEKDYIIPVTIAINTNGRITSFSFRPPFKKTLSVSDIVEKLKSLNYEKKAILIKKLTQIEKTLYSYNDEESFAIGQAFTLYILSYLAENEKRWDRVVRVDHNHKSFSSSTINKYPESAPATIFTLAYHMISESDSTATDILIDYIGKQKLEHYIKDKNSNYILNLPFLKTKEAFRIKMKPNFAQKYQQASTDEKREMLRYLEDDETNTYKLDSSTTPFINTADWFASPKDICLLMDHIRIINNPFANAILSLNPGLDLKSGGYLWGGFKGGRESGVLTLNWLLKAKDEKYYCISIMINDSKKDIYEAEVFELSQNLLNIFATE
ncbi:MAG: serine hydrolase [Elusimicrobiales bacterium]